MVEPSVHAVGIVASGTIFKRRTKAPKNVCFSMRVTRAVTIACLAFSVSASISVRAVMVYPFLRLRLVVRVNAVCPPVVRGAGCGGTFCKLHNGHCQYLSLHTLKPLIPSALQPVNTQALDETGACELSKYYPCHSSTRIAEHDSFSRPYSHKPRHAPLNVLRRLSCRITVKLIVA